MSTSMELNVVAALLRQGALLHGLSRLAMLVALLALLLVPVLHDNTAIPLIAFAASLLAGLVQTVFAVRVGLDAALFEQLARHCDEDGLPSAQTTLALDTALQRQFALPEHKRGRDWLSRIAGARRLFCWQLATLGVQWLLLVCGICAVIGGQPA